MIAATEITGIAAVPGGAVVVDRTGGLFHAVSGGETWPAVTPLPPGVTRLERVGEALVACTPDAGPAWSSVDGGRGFARLGFSCGEADRRTLAETADGAAAILPDGTLRLGPLSGGAARRVVLSVPGPYTLGADGPHLVVFGAGAALWSDDAGHTLQPASVPSSGPTAIRDVVFHKGTAVAVGEAGSDGLSVLYSADAGRTWAAVADLPRRSEDLSGASLSPLGRLVAVTRGPGRAFESPDAGRSWYPVSHPDPLAGAVAPWGAGFLVGSPRGLLRPLDAAAPALPPLGLAGPLWDVVFTHPRVAVGAGTEGGLYATVDGGRRWWLLRGTAALRFWGVASPGGHVVVAVGEHALWRADDLRSSWVRLAPAGCRARWVRFPADGGAGFVGCLEGGVLRSADAGRTFGLKTGPGEPLRRVEWLGTGRLVALSEDGATLHGSDDDGVTWWSRPAPRSGVVHVAAAPDETISLAMADGEVYRATEASGPWIRVPSPAGLEGRSVRAHLPLGEARTLFLTSDALVEATGSTSRALASTPEAERMVLTGDGGLVVLQTPATTLLEAR